MDYTVLGELYRNEWCRYPSKKTVTQTLLLLRILGLGESTARNPSRAHLTPGNQFHQLILKTQQTGWILIHLQPTDLGFCFRIGQRVLQVQ